MQPDTIRLAIEALEYLRWHPKIYYSNKAIDVAIAELQATQQGQAQQMPGPNWEHGPLWAQYFTRDENGRFMWWETEPFFDKRMGIWMCEDDSRRTGGTDTPTLRSRPAQGEARDG